MTAICYSNTPFFKFSSYMHSAVAVYTHIMFCTLCRGGYGVDITMSVEWCTYTHREPLTMKYIWVLCLQQCLTGNFLLYSELATHEDLCHVCSMM